MASIVAISLAKTRVSFVNLIVALKLNIKLISPNTVYPAFAFMTASNTCDKGPHKSKTRSLQRILVFFASLGKSLTVFFRLNILDYT